MKNLYPQSTIIFLFLLGNIFLNQSIYAQDSSINVEPFIRVQESTVSEKQKEIISIIKNEPTTVETRIIKLVDFKIEKCESITLELFDDKKYTFSIRKVIKRSDNDYTWIGKVSTEGNITLTKQGNDISAIIDFNSQRFTIDPLGDGLHAIVKIDQSKFRDEECNEQKLKRKSKEKDIDNSNSDQTNTIQPDILVIIDVIVAYTESAKNASGNINTIIQNALDDATISYENSNIDIELSLIHTFEADYDETGKSSATIVNQFRNDNDGHVDEIHDFRDEYNADVCFLVTNSSLVTGRAYKIDNVSAADAFAIGNYNYIRDHRTFAHEIGHLQGARHNIEEDPLGTYNHGYLYTPGNWRTIMSYRSDGGTEVRQNFWSNPYQTWGGVARGIIDESENKKQLNNTRNSVSGFYVFQTSGTITSDHHWRRDITLTGNVYVPDGITLTIDYSASVNLNGYYVKCTGSGVIIKYLFANINPDIRVYQSGGAKKGLYSTIMSALNNSTSGQYVKPYDQITINENIIVASNKTLTIPVGSAIYLNGHYVKTTGGSINKGGIISPDKIHIIQSSQIKGYYPTIWSAANDVTSGQTIQLANGTYNESRYIGIYDDNISLEGTSRSNTIINADVQIGTADNITISDLTIDGILCNGFSSFNNVINVKVEERIVDEYNDYHYYENIIGSNNSSEDLMSVYSDFDMFQHGNMFRTDKNRCLDIRETFFVLIESEINNCQNGVYLTGSSTYAMIVGNYFYNDCDIYVGEGCELYKEGNIRYGGGGSAEEIILCGPGSSEKVAQNKSSSNSLSVLTNSTNTQYREAIDIFINLRQNLRNNKSKRRLEYETDYKKVISIIENVLQSYEKPNSLGALQILISCYNAIDRHDTAINYLQNIFEDSRYEPFQYQIEMLLIRNYILNKDYSNALKVLNTIDELADTKDRSAEVLLCRAMFYNLCMKDNNNALKLYSEIIDEYPDSRSAKSAKIKLKIITTSPNAYEEYAINDNNNNANFTLLNYPNPFNPTTTFRYTAPWNGILQVEIFNSLGQRVRHFKEIHFKKGSSQLVWNGQNDIGIKVTSGVYFVRFRAVSSQDKVYNFEGFNKVIFVK